MTPLYFAATLILSCFLLGAWGRLSQAKDDAAYERLFYYPWHAAKRREANVAVVRSRLIVILFAAVLVAWIAWLVWGRS